MILSLSIACDDHSEEIAECKQCDTLVDLKVSFEDPSAITSGDTVTVILKKSPGFLPVKHLLVLQNGRKEFLINDTIHASDSLMITHRGILHVYYGFKKDWYYMATMSDHNAGQCGLHDYFIDGKEVNESGMVLDFPK